MKQKTAATARQLALCALFTALIAVGAFIRIPLPYVAFSMQTFFVALAGMLLGKKWGAVSVAAYLAIGLIGLPVFTKGGGPMYVLEPSFGFLIGFVLYAFLTGVFTKKLKTPTVKGLILAQLPGLFAMYAVALPYFYLVSKFYLGAEMGVAALFIYCFAATLPGDAVKCVLAAWLGKRLLRNVEFRM